IIAKLIKLKAHLAYKYKKVNSNIRIKVLILLTSNCIELDNNIALTSTTKTNKKYRLESSISIDNNYENVSTSPSKENQINKIVLKIVIDRSYRPINGIQKNYSNIPHHISIFLEKEIITIVEDIGPEKIAAIITNNESNI
ncbi:4301_t:CDS:2, partial [Dentiscutata erythropus]